MSEKFPPSGAPRTIALPDLPAREDARQMSDVALSDLISQY